MSDSLFAPYVEIANVPLPVDGSGVTQPVSGTVGVNNFPATQPISGNVGITGTVNVITALSSNATITQVVLTNNTNSTLLSVNPNRKSAIIFAPSQPLQIKYGAVASATSFTYKIVSPNTTLIITGWSGQIDAFGAAQTITITELV